MKLSWETHKRKRRDIKRQKEDAKNSIGNLGNVIPLLQIKWIIGIGQSLLEFLDYLPSERITPDVKQQWTAHTAKLTMAWREPIPFVVVAPPSRWEEQLGLLVRPTFFFVGNTTLL
jgi:hypothetical protein